MSPRLVIALLFVALVSLLPPTSIGSALAVGCGPAAADLGAAQNNDRELWRATGTDGSNLSTALITDETVVVVESARGCVLSIISIQGIDAATGDTLWTIPSEQFGRIDGAPKGIGSTIYLFASVGIGTPTPGHSLIAIDADTGTIRWQIDLDGSNQNYYRFASGDADSLIAIGGGNDNDRLIAIDPQSGATRWSTPMTSVVRTISVDIPSDRFYVINGAYGDEATLSLYDLSTGDQTWSVPVHDAESDATTDLVASVDAGVVVAVNGAVSLFSAEDGTTVWEQAAPTGLGDDARFNFWQFGETLLAYASGQDGAQLSARTISNGADVWTRDFPDTDLVLYVNGPRGAVAAGDFILMSTSTVGQDNPDGIIVLELATGATRWMAPSASQTTFTYGGDLIYVTDNDGGSGHLTALSAAAGTQVWTMAFPDLTDLRISSIGTDVIYLLASTETDTVLVAVRR